MQPAWCCGTSLCLSVAASCQLLAKIVTDYLLILLLFQLYSCVRRCLRVSRSSSLDFCQPTSPASPSALSPWKPSPTGFDGCLRRRLVPHTTHLTNAKSPSPAMPSLLALALTSLQTPLLQHPAGGSSRLPDSPPLFPRLAPPQQRCVTLYLTLDRALKTKILHTSMSPLTTLTPSR